ncbi:hypothetical protein RB16p249 [Escherichia phage RB16]|uniref:Uncharacterized protein n=1 Tax=Escherichia phage RB16 TaxID=2681599 RepID=D9ICW0_BPRB1|nr:hypothetical protein RB16p249 [Escherichia phage RB16]ADJ55553.1 hypothetical protein RB16p249 [Escherichia phage RB16]
MIQLKLDTHTLNNLFPEAKG